MSIGYVYVLSNMAMGNLLKVGYTCNSVEQRVRELSSASGVPRPFTVEYYLLTNDAEDVEALVHQELEAHRVGREREFFEVAVQLAIESVERHARTVNARFVRPRLSSAEELPKFICRRCGFAFDKTAGDELCPSCGF